MADALLFLRPFLSYAAELAALGPREERLTVRKGALQRHNSENSKKMFLEKELRDLSPNFYIHVPVTDLNIPFLGIHKSDFRRSEVAYIPTLADGKWSQSKSEQKSVIFFNNYSFFIEELRTTNNAHCVHLGTCLLCGRIHSRQDSR